MKNVNFITTLSPEQQYEIRRWFILSMVILICTITAISCFMAPHIYALYTTQQEITALEKKTSNYTQSTSTKDALKKEHELLQNKLIRINRYVNQSNNPHSYLAAIIASCGSDAQLEQVRKNKKTCETTTRVPTPERATHMIQQLSGSEYFTDLKLTSLQHDSQTKKFRSTTKCTIKT